MAVMQAQSSVISQIQKIIRGFLWSRNLINEKTLPLISLQDMAHTLALGGVGIHDFTTRNKVFGGKLAWHMYTKSQSVWCQIMQ